MAHLAPRSPLEWTLLFTTYAALQGWALDRIYGTRWKRRVRLRICLEPTS